MAGKKVKDVVTKVEVIGDSDAEEASDEMSNNNGSEGDKSTNEGDKSTNEDYFTPVEMKDLLEGFFETVQDEENVYSRMRSFKTVESYAKKALGDVDDYTVKKFVKTYSYYLRKWGYKTSFEIDKQVFDFILNKNPDTLKLYGDYPSKTAGKQYIYAKLNNIPYSIKTMKEVGEKMKQDDHGRLAAEQKIAAYEDGELKHLEAFKNKHEDELSEHLLSIIDKRIGGLRKRLFGEKTQKRAAPSNNNSSKAKKAKMEKKSADVFELFVRTNGGDYNHLDPEKKMKKLRKKFERLSSEERGIYEKCFKAQ